MSIVGNFIVGFDTDTLSVFRDLLDFIDEHNILYPFFSILTPMPGTKLHEDYKAAGRLDHFDWARYDTRHVVFEPAHMTREQLMDGYCWLYEEAYASERALLRLERYWSRWRRKGSGVLEKGGAAALLWKYRKEGSARFQRLLQDGQRRLWGNPKGDVGQLFYYLDSGHFCDYLDRFRSGRYAENVRIFRGEAEAEAVEERLLRKQWERKSASAAAAPSVS
jgi:hypothetical protein